MKVRTVPHGRIKERRKPEPAHKARISKMPCLACGSMPVEVHHVRHDGKKSIGKDDKLVVPLCPNVCHRNGRNAVHVIGHPAFCSLWGLDLYREAQRLWDDYNG